MFLNIKQVTNGYIVKHGKETLVFHNPADITKWMNEEYPVTKNRILLVSYPRDKQIATIKAVREVTQWGLKESKDFTDAVRNGQKMLLPELNTLNTVLIQERFNDIGAEYKMM